MTEVNGMNIKERAPPGILGEVYYRPRSWNVQHHVLVLDLFPQPAASVPAAVPVSTDVVRVDAQPETAADNESAAAMDTPAATAPHRCRRMSSPPRNSRLTGRPTTTRPTLMILANEDHRRVTCEGDADQGRWAQPPGRQDSAGLSVTARPRLQHFRTPPGATRSSTGAGLVHLQREI